MGNLILVFVIVSIVLVVIKVIADRSRARTAYHESLEKLKRDPHNPDLREKTLALGREYVRALRQSGRESTFTEVALMNDVNAACARAGSRVTIEADERSASIEERLQKLDDLRSRQLISEQEHQSRRQQILEEL